MSRPADRCTVVRLRAARVADPYSGEATRRDWSNPHRRAIGGVNLQPSDGTEDTARAQQSTLRWSLEVIGWPDLRDEDRIEWAGHTWDVTNTVTWPGRRRITTATIYRQEG